MRTMIVVGAGGFAREVLDLIDAINAEAATADRFDVLGVVAPEPPEDAKLATYGVPYLGDDAALLEQPASVEYVVAIGSGPARRALADLHAGRTAATLVHPTATIGRTVEIGPGSIITSHVSVTNHISIGSHVQVNLNCTIGHDAVLEDFATLSPMVAISGYARVGAGAFLGTGAVLNPGVTVGAWAVVGSGAAVVRDVAPETTAVGVPARARS